MGEEERLYPHPLRELLLPSEPVSQYRCMDLPKTDGNDRTHKKIQIPYLDIWSMLLSGQVPHRSNSSHMFWNLEDLVLVQTVSYRRKITYHLLLIGFFHKLISSQCNVAFTCSSTAAIYICTSELSLLPMTMMLS